MAWEIASRSDRTSAKFLVPKMFLRVVMAKSRVELLCKTTKCFVLTWYLDYSPVISYFDDCV